MILIGSPPNWHPEGAPGVWHQPEHSPFAAHGFYDAHHANHPQFAMAPMINPSRGGTGTGQKGKSPPRGRFAAALHNAPQGHGVAGAAGPKGNYAPPPSSKYQNYAPPPSSSTMVPPHAASVYPESYVSSYAASSPNAFEGSVHGSTMDGYTSG